MSAMAVIQIAIEYFLIIRPRNKKKNNNNNNNLLSGVQDKFMNASLI